MTNSHHFAVIMAGGSGVRLWPMSRKATPKQFQKIVGNDTMLQVMYGLLREVLPPEQILVQAKGAFRPMIAEQLPDLSPSNIIIEPEARDTGPAFCFAVATLLNRDAEAVVGVFWSDHIIGNRANFVNALTTAFMAVADYPDHIVSIGIKPTFPHTGLGYIQMKEEAKVYQTGETFEVKRFIEKPDLVNAVKFVKSWEYLWNAGYSVFRAKGFWDILAQANPEAAKITKSLQKRLAKGADDKVATLFGQLPKLSVDYLVMEKTDKLLVVPADLDWSDIGDWKSLHDILSQATSHHMVTKGNHVGMDCEGCLVYGQDRIIATLGLKDVVVVDTGDAILVMDKHRAQDIKKMVAQLEENDKHMYL